jgi:hypothetical protein
MVDFIIIISIFFFKDLAILGPFLPLEEYTGPSIFTVDVLYHFFHLGCILELKG